MDFVTHTAVYVQKAFEADDRLGRDDAHYAAGPKAGPKAVTHLTGCEKSCEPGVVARYLGSCLNLRFVHRAEVLLQGPDCGDGGVERLKHIGPHIRLRFAACCNERIF